MQRADFLSPKGGKGELESPAEPGFDLPQGAAPER